MLCSCLLFSPVNKPPSSKEEKDKTTQESKTSMNAVAYISSGVALLLLLIVSIMVGIWCYSKSHRKKIERFVSLKVITLFCQVFRDPEDGEQSCPPLPNIWKLPFAVFWARLQLMSLFRYRRLEVSDNQLTSYGSIWTFNAIILHTSYVWLFYILDLILKTILFQSSHNDHPSILIGWWILSGTGLNNPSLRSVCYAYNLRLDSFV